MTATGVGPDAGPTRLPAQEARAGDGAGPDHPEPAPVPVDEDIGAGEAAPRLLKVFGGIVAPTSLLTGLLFYFGRSRSAGYYAVPPGQLHGPRPDDQRLPPGRHRRPVRADRGREPARARLPVAEPAAPDPAAGGRATAGRPDPRPGRSGRRGGAHDAGLPRPADRGRGLRRQQPGRRALPGPRRAPPGLRGPPDPAVPAAPCTGARAAVAGDRPRRVGRSLPPGEHRAVLGRRRLCVRRRDGRGDAAAPGAAGGARGRHLQRAEPQPRRPRGDRDAVCRSGRRLPVPLHRPPPGAPGRQPVRRCCRRTGAGSRGPPC